MEADRGTPGGTTRSLNHRRVTLRVKTETDQRSYDSICICVLSHYLLLSQDQCVGCSSTQYPRGMLVGSCCRLLLVRGSDRPSPSLETDAIEWRSPLRAKELDELAGVWDADWNHQVGEIQALVTGSMEGRAQAAADVAANHSVQTLRWPLEVANDRFSLGDGKLAGRCR